MRPIALSFTPVVADTAGYLTGATGAGPFIPTALEPGDTLAHLFTIDSSADLSLITFTVTGIDMYGDRVVEDIVGPNATTVDSVNYYLSIESVSVSATLGLNTADFGWANGAYTKPIVLSYVNQTFSVGMGITVSGTIDYTVQHTFTDLFDKTLPYPPNWFNHSFLITQTTSADGNYAFNVLAVRMLLNSFTAGATVIWELVQGSGTN